ncbi:MAG: Abi family protein [Oscillibacter sp.]
MPDKPFKTYAELIVMLRDEKKLTIPPAEEPRAIALLKKYSYFSLVSGYKTLLKAGDGTYLPSAGMDDILALYQFDDALRDSFFQAIQTIEKHIKSLLSYSFVDHYGAEQGQYTTAANFDALPGSKDEGSRQREIKKLISTFVYAVTPPSDHDYIKHQWTAHQNVPLWASVKAMTFGSISKMFSLCYPQVQSDVAREFAGVSTGALAVMLDMLTRVRNVCAHNERLYDFSVKKSRAIPNMPIHAQLGISKSGSGLYSQGKTDLFAALVCFRYLLEPDDFQKAVSGIDAALANLFADTKLVPQTRILSCMGFPANWREIAG